MTGSTHDKQTDARPADEMYDVAHHFRTVKRRAACRRCLSNTACCHMRAERSDPFRESSRAHHSDTANRSDLDIVGRGC